MDRRDASMPQRALAQAEASGVCLRFRAVHRGAVMSMTIGLTLGAMALPGGAAGQSISIQFHADNGSLPPPYRRSTQISVDAAGHGQFIRRHGYDLTDPAQRFAADFVLDIDQQQAFARRLDEIGAWQTRWKAQLRPPVGGPLVHLRLVQGERVVELPAFPQARQQARAAAVRAAVLALVPEAIQAQRQLWEQGRSEAE